MIVKTLTLTGGLFGAAFVSQYPEFTQQYMQRLGGQVSALSVVISDFDASAARADMSRDEALASMGGSVFLENRRKDMRRSIDRHAALTLDLEHLQNATALERLTMPHHVLDRDTVQATWADFVPAMPLSPEGLISGVAGFFGGYVGSYGVLGLLAWPFRRRRKPKDGLTF